MKNLFCIICDKGFAVNNWRIGRAKYCSYECSNKGRTTGKSYDKPRKCIKCEIKFYPTTWYQKYCSKKCFGSVVTKIGTKKCVYCSKTFKQSRVKQIYCSRECSKPYKIKALKKPKQTSLDNLWAKKIKELADYKCEYCGKTTGLNSHHIFSRSNRRVRWDLDNGISVCVLHHVFGTFSAHKAPIEFVEWLKEYRGEDWYLKLIVKAKITIPYKRPNKEEEMIIRENLQNY